MNPTSKKFITLFLIFSLVALSGNLYAKKRGTELIIQKRDGQQIRGELIVVKKNSLLLLESESSADVSVNINEIKVIKVMKKSKWLLGAGLGLLIGALGGALIDSKQNASDCTECPGDEHGFLIGAPLGTLTGVIVGNALVTDKTIQIEGMSDLEIRDALDKLRKKARIRDYK